MGIQIGSGQTNSATAMMKDGNNNAIQVPSTWQPYDGASSPVLSPKTNIGTSGSAQAFTPPAGALYFIFQSSAAAFVGLGATLDGSTAAKSYKKVAATTDYRIPCAAGTVIYICAASGTVDVDFFFEMI